MSKSCDSGQHLSTSIITLNTVNNVQRVTTFTFILLTTHNNRPANTELYYIIQNSHFYFKNNDLKFTTLDTDTSAQTQCFWPIFKSIHLPVHHNVKYSKYYIFMTSHCSTVPPHKLKVFLAWHSSIQTVKKMSVNNNGQCLKCANFIWAQKVKMKWLHLLKTLKPLDRTLSTFKIKHSTITTAGEMTAQKSKVKWCHPRFPNPYM